MPGIKTILPAVLLSLFAVFSVKVKHELRADKSPLEAIKIGEPLPDFTLRNPVGDEVTLSQSVRDNKLVMINFWASWCAPCRVEMPGFEKLYTTRNKDGFTILAINEDEERKEMDAYLAEKPVSFPVLLDREKALMNQFGVHALPTTILVGRDGKVQAVYEGVQEYVEFMIDSQLKAAPSPR